MLAILYMGLSFMVGLAAQNHRGRQGTPWFLLALVMSPPLAAILLLVLKDKRTATITVKHESASFLGKTCPRCAEDVKIDAKVCRYCQHEFT